MHKVRSVVGLLALVALALPAPATAATVDPENPVCTVQDAVATPLLNPAETTEPQILAVYRNTDGPRATWEPAYLSLSDDVYWARGDDVVIEVAVPGAGYSLEVFRNNRVMHTEPLSACDPYVRVPLAAHDGVFPRSFRYAGATGRGPEASQRFGVDATPPVLVNASRVDASTTDIRFSERIVAGDDRSENWFATERVTAWDGRNTRTHTQVFTVTPVDAQTRRLTHHPLGAGFFDVNYVRLGGERYTDVGGNKLADTIAVTVN